jgi:hypothetical protein
MRRRELSRHDREDAPEMALVSALRTLLTGIVDYAGLFPPATLNMTSAVQEYATSRSGPDAWMLGRFVVPATRLDELDRAREALTPEERSGWRVSALLGEDVEADLARVDAFNAAHAGDSRVDSVEAKLTSPSAVARAAEMIAKRYSLFVEIPVKSDPASLISAIDEWGATAKIRTGGLTQEAFPPAPALIRFIRRCIESKGPFKATAGLHHPLPAEYKLSYEPDAPRGKMFGFLNVFLASAFMRVGMDDRDALRLLDDGDRASFKVDARTIRWRDYTLTSDQVADARKTLAVSFGSCSFREPVQELAALGIAS